MHNFKLVIAITLSTLWSVNTYGAEVFKWVDSQGNVHFGDKPPEQEKLEVVKLGQSNSFTQVSANSEENAMTQQKKIVMYATSWCPYCKKARAYFKDNGLTFTEYNVENSPSKNKEFKALGGTGYPLILIGKQDKMQGFSVSAFEKRFNK